MTEYEMGLRVGVQAQKSRLMFFAAGLLLLTIFLTVRIFLTPPDREGFDQAVNTEGRIFLAGLSSLATTIYLFNFFITSKKCGFFIWPAIATTVLTVCLVVLFLLGSYAV